MCVADTLPSGFCLMSLASMRGHLYVTRYTEGFSHFVSSMTAPVASGWSVRRVGPSPLESAAFSRRTQWRTFRTDVANGLMSATSPVPGPSRPGLIEAAQLRQGANMAGTTPGLSRPGLQDVVARRFDPTPGPSRPGLIEAGRVSHGQRDASGIPAPLRPGLIEAPYPLGRNTSPGNIPRPLRRASLK